MKYNQKLPKNVEKQLDDYIQRIKDIKWFKPSQSIKREEIDSQINLSLKAFGVEANIEYRTLKTSEDWGAAQDAARDAARGADDVLALNLDNYKTKYPNGSFITLIPLWEAGLYPCGVIDGSFVVYVPEKEFEIPQLTGSLPVEMSTDNYAIVDGVKYKLIKD